MRPFVQPAALLPLLALVLLGGLVACAPAGEVEAPPLSVEPDPDWRFPVRQGVRVGFIDGTGELVIEPQFGSAGPMAEGLIPVRRGEPWGYIDASGEMVIEPDYTEAAKFSDGRAAVGRGLRAGYIDTDGTPIIDPQFGNVDDFYLGLGRVRLDVEDARRFGYVDRSGAYVWFPSD